MVVGVKNLADPDALNSILLFTMRVRVAHGWEIARSSSGECLSICGFDGGEFHGPRLRGEVLPVGGDWASVRSDRLVRINVAGLLCTDDHALIAFRYEGVWATSAGLLPRLTKPDGHLLFNPVDNYLRVTATFETGEARYSWLNEMIAIGVGRKIADGIQYTFHQVL